MDDSPGPTIEKIKQQHQEKEIRIIEQRELNAAKLSIYKAIHDANIEIEKLKEEHQSLIDRTDELQKQVLVETTRRDALLDQVNACRKAIAELHKASFEGVSSVWEKRSKLFDAVKDISGKCDIWALLTKPKIDKKPNITNIPNRPQLIENNTKLKAAIDRKNKAIAMRNFLLNEPDTGEEFIRIRNALQYSMEIMAQDQNKLN